MTQSTQQLEAWLKKRGGWNGTKKSTKVSLFALPIECIPCLATTSIETIDSIETKSQRVSIADIGVTTNRGLTCIACQLTFGDVREQQLHFKSDLHLINLKRRVHGLTALLSGDVDTNESLDSRIDPSLGEDDGEDSDSSEDRDLDNDFEASQQETLQNAEYRNELGCIKKEFSAQRGPTLHLWDVNLPQWELVVSTGLFATSSAFHTREWNSASEAAKPSPWTQLSTQIEHIRRNRICGVFLLRSGRFAGAIFDGQTLLIHKVLKVILVLAVTFDCKYRVSN